MTQKLIEAVLDHNEFCWVGSPDRFLVKLVEYYHVNPKD